MAIILKVTPEVLTRMAEDIEKQISDIQNQFSSIDTEVCKTRSYWEGDASEKHKAQYDSLKKEMDEAVKRLKSQPVNLLKMAGLYTETESQQKEVAQSLSADVIV
jgi:WXG100 family type VII secretion target